VCGDGLDAACCLSSNRRALPTGKRHPPDWLKVKIPDNPAMRRAREGAVVTRKASAVC
jgi:hypothetical protein